MKKTALFLVLIAVAATMMADAGAVIAPRSIRRVETIWPLEARLKGVRGTMQLVASIDEQGNVRDVSVVKGLPIRGFGLEKATIDAVKAWKFAPATKDGQPVPVPFRLTVTYR